jgi:hypothetical protein
MRIAVTTAWREVFFSGNCDVEVTVSWNKTNPGNNLILAVDTFANEIAFLGGAQGQYYGINLRKGSKIYLIGAQVNDVVWFYIKEICPEVCNGKGN